MSHTQELIVAMSEFNYAYTDMTLTDRLIILPRVRMLYLYNIYNLYALKLNYHYP